MDLKQFLDTNPLINQAELARMMWPDKQKTAKTRLSNKLNEVKMKNSKQRITDDDLELAKTALRNLGVNIEGFAGK